MEAAELREGAQRLKWFHTIDLGEGVVTDGLSDTPSQLERIALADRLDGRSVLDVGAWDGFFSFECERRGAARVVATDSWSWGPQSWSSKEGFNFARRALGSAVEDIDVDVMDLAPERVGGTYDLVLFLGVLYHLRHPLLALERVASVTSGQLILETSVDLLGLRRPAMAFYEGKELEGDPTNWWGPNAAAVAAMLRSVGFSRVEVVHPRSRAYALARAARRLPRGLAAARQGRLVAHAWR
jgi:tRNA (mo5U34)-methyltransferase